MSVAAGVVNDVDVYVIVAATGADAACLNAFCL